MSKRRNFETAFMTGLIGGIVGSWVMNQYWTIMAKMKEKQASPSELAQLRTSQEQQQLDNPTVKVAEIISGDIFGHQLDDWEKKLAGPFVHYAFGAVTGAFYGLVAELLPRVSAGCGTAYGIAIWLGADEIMVPALKLSKAPEEYPLSQHLSGLGAHLAYGIALEAVRRPLRWIF
jgi:putative membrane protein